MTKIDIFSGFLGAGKTTLIKKLISEAYSGEKLVLIENEFGDIGIDGGFLQDAGVNITEMNSGCICCSLVGDFGKALKQVLRDYTPDRIVIEPSGVGKLSDVIRAVQDVKADIQLNAIATVVDVNKCKMYMKNFGEFFNNQIESAHTIILSHTAKTTDTKLSNAVELIRQHNADADILTTDWDQLTGPQILEMLEKKNTLSAELEKLAGEVHHHHDHGEECSCGHDHHHHDHGEECTCGHDHHHDHVEECTCGHDHHHDHGEECTCGHDHHHHHADEVFTSYGAETGRRYTAEEITAILSALEDEAKYGMVLRAKGIVNGTEGFIHFDYVPGEADVRSGSAAPTGRICVIGAQLDEAALKELFML